MADEQRIAPHNAEAERQLLGAILVNNDTFYRVADFLRPEHFFIPQHQDIYSKCGQLIAEGKTASPITLKTFYPADAKIADLSAMQFLLRLAADAASAINAEDYGSQIYDLFLRREIISISGAMSEASFEQSIDVPPTKIIDEISSRLFELRPVLRDEEADNQAVVENLREHIDAKREGRSLPIAMTGLVDVDRILTGLNPTRLIVVAARPGMGKTQFQKAIERRVARQGFGVASFSLEISKEECLARLTAAEAAMSHYPLSYSDIMSGEMDEAHYQSFLKHSQTAANLPIKIDDRGGLSIGQIEVAVRKMANEFERDGRELGLISVDYLQIMGSGGRYKGQRVNEISEITAGFKALAKRLRVPIMLLSQLSRDVEKREDKRPVLSDLRDSGSIEQDADQVIFLYRPAYYDAKIETQDLDLTDVFESRKNDLEVIIAKNRCGPAKSVTVYCDIGKTDIADKSKR